MKQLFTLLLLLCIGRANAQTVIYSENFNSGSAAGFTLNTTDLGGDASLADNQWVINNIYADAGFGVTTPDEPTAITGSPESNYLHIFSALGVSLGLYNANDVFDAGASGSYFASSASMSTVGYSGTTLYFWWLCQGSAAACGKVYYRTSATGSWTQIMTPIATFHGSGSWNRDSVSSAAFDGQAYLQFGFQFNNSATGSDPAFGIDDIIVTGSSVSAPPTITTNPSDATVCPGATTSFTATASGATAYQWQRSTTGVGGTFVNITTGMDGGIYGASFTTTTLTITAPTALENGYAYQMVATNATGSSTSAPAVLTVSSTPSAGTIVGMTNVCVGGTITLTDGTSGGTWTTTSGIASVGAATGVVTGSAAGSATISYTVSTPCGTATATFNVTVVTSPSAGTITGSTTVCAGSSVTLSDATSGGTWTSASTALATVSGSGVVTGVVAGVDIISYTVTTSCGTAYATYTITVNPAGSAGTITGTDSVCIASMVNLIDTTGTGTWSCSNAHATVSSSGMVTGVTAGLDTVYYNMTSGACGIVTTSMVVNVKPRPNPIIHTLPGHVLALTGTYSSYQWLKMGTIITGATSATYVFTVTANYQVIVDSAGCSDTSAAHTFNVGINELAMQSSDFTISQNDYSATIVSSMPLLADLDVKVYDLTGRVVTATNWAAGNSSLHINDARLAIGIYLVQLKNENTNVFLKWVR